MSDPTETGGRPLASTIQQPQGSTHSPSPRRRHRNNSQSSDERTDGTRSSPSRRRSAVKKQLSLGPHAGSSRGDSSTMQRSLSPTQMSPDMPSINYTRTGRISKAKKGLKVHNCECGRSYTRAEHLRRHQKNHASEAALVCEFPDCGKTFYRLDLLQRHQERHNEIGRESQRQPYMTPGTSAEGPHTPALLAQPTPIDTTLPQPTPYYNVDAAIPESSTDPSHTKRPAFPVRQTIGIPISVDGNGDLPSWNEAYTPSPGGNNSSSSGYTSPILPLEQPSIFPWHFGPGLNRSRSGSNASLIEPWGYPSRSPTSTTGSMAHTWITDKHTWITDKHTAPANPLAYMHPMSYLPASVPMSAGVDVLSGYGAFGPKTMAQRDEEEQATLFPDQSFGMDQFATYPYGQYLDNYWRLFHPSFPIVHRATFDGMSTSPMLRAAMIAIGAQYSNDACAKRKARILLDRCIKLLNRRDLDVMTEVERLCDYQALLLVEFLSQYRARRAPQALSTRFESLYHRGHENFRGTTSRIMENLSAVVQSENVTLEHWNEWIELAGEQRLLQGCYILEYQQSIYLARSSRSSMIPTSGFDLPFPAHSSLWDAPSHTEWAFAVQQQAHIHAHMPTYIFDISPDFTTGLFDAFQSALLIAVHYNHFNNATPYLSPPVVIPVEHLLDSSLSTKHQLLVAKLAQLTPLRALLAVSGESWIFSEKVPNAPAYNNHKATLNAWVNGLWEPPADLRHQTVKEALKLAIELLQQSMLAARGIHLDLGADMGLYFALLVIWAVTVAADTRINVPRTQSHSLRQQTPSPLPYDSCGQGHMPITPQHLSAVTSRASQSPNPMHPAATGLMPPTTPSSNAYAFNSLPFADIETTAIEFLHTALFELDLLGMTPQWPKDVAQWQQGCGALVRWVKMRLRNGAPEGRDSVIGVGPTSASTGHGGDGYGELLDSVIRVLEKIMNRGWEGLGV